MADPGDTSRDNGPPDEATDGLPFCNLPADGLDEDGCVSSDYLKTIDLTKCQLRPDTCFSLGEPGEAQAPAPRAVTKVITHIVKKAAAKAVRKMEVPMEEHDTVPSPAPTPEQITPLPAPMRATVAMPDNALGDIQKLLPADGNASMITVLLAVVGVAGGGAAFKFYRSWQKSRHEQEMKRLEIEEKKAEKQDDKHEACNAARAALEARVASLEGQLANTVASLEQKVAEIQKSNSTVSLGDFDPEELEDRLKKDEDRLKKLEKALKPAPTAKKR